MMASHHPRSTLSVIFILCCGLLLLIVMVEASEDRGSTERNSTETQYHRVTRSRRHYCGKALTDTLAMVCNSYPSPWRKKSDYTMANEESFEGSYREQLIEEIKQDLEELEQLAPEVFDDRASAPQALQFHPYYPRSYQEPPPMPVEPYRRVRRQIVDECCRKSCTLKTLKQYCAD
ncbi:LIRP-like isoform X1 [Armigeres subalbatus]|uniref:LIRP-like isoform X1 n=1 Tax=Armigeres subalbatus TaxID=124917 RepID=UPI002ED47D25